MLLDSKEYKVIGKIVITINYQQRSIINQLVVEEYKPTIKIEKLHFKIMLII